MARTVVVVDGQKKKPLAKLTWDGKKLHSDNASFLSYLKAELGSAADGDLFLQRVLKRYQSGYMHAYQVGQSDE